MALIVAGRLTLLFGWRNFRLTTTYRRTHLGLRMRNFPRDVLGKMGPFSISKALLLMDSVFKIENGEFCSWGKNDVGGKGPRGRATSLVYGRGLILHRRATPVKRILT